MPILIALAVMAVTLILSPRTFFLMMVVWAVFALLAPPEWKYHRWKHRHTNGDTE